MISYSSSVSGPALWRIARGVLILPTSWIAAAVRIRRTSSFGRPMRLAIIQAWRATLRECPCR